MPPTTQAASAPAALLRHRGIACALLAAMLATLLLALVGPGRLQGSLGGASWAHVAAAALAGVLFFALRGLRWALLLPGRRPSAATAAGMTAVAWTVSTFVPLKAGDAVRAGWMARRTQGSLAGVAGTIAVERAFDLLGLALLGSLGLLWLGATVDAGPAWLQALLAVAWIAPLAALAVLFAASRMSWARPQGRIRAAAAAALARSPARFVAVAVLTIACTATQAAGIACLALAVTPGAALAATAAAAPLFLLTFAIPLTPGHLGTYEAGFVAAFSVAGTPASALLAPALAAHVIAMGLSITLGAAGLLLVSATARTPMVAPTASSGGPRAKPSPPLAAAPAGAVEASP